MVLEALHASIERYDEEPATGVVYLGGRFEMTPVVALVVELPHIRIDAAYRDPLGDGFTWEGEANGNPYLGVELHPSGSDIFLELGARAPLMPEDHQDAYVFGLYVDPSRVQVFAPSTVPVQLVLNMRHATSAGLLTRLRFGPILAAPTKNTDVRELELYAVFAWQVGYEGKMVRVGGAISGQSLLTEGYPPLGARTTSQFEFHSDFGDWLVRPGVDLRLPIGEDAEIVSVLVGGSLGVAW